MKQLLHQLLPFPLLSAALLGMWILLAGFSPTTLLLGAIVAILVAQSMHVLGVEGPKLRLGWPLLKLAGMVFADIVRSNIAVARIVLLNPPNRYAGFIRLPTELRDRTALAAMAAIITSTPGTIWVHHDREQHIILIHVLDLVDEAHWITLLKTRYEKLLLEIFE